MFEGEITERYELIPLPPTFLCNNYLVALKSGKESKDEDLKVLEECFSVPWNGRIEGHEQGFRVSVYNSD